MSSATAKGRNITQKVISAEGKVISFQFRLFLSHFTVIPTKIASEITAIEYKSLLH